MDQILSPLEAEAVQQNGQHLEMVILFIAYHINHLVDRIILKTQFGCSDILGHIDGCTILTKQKFFIKSLIGQIGPNRPIIMTNKETFFQSALYFCLSYQIGL